VVPAAVDLPVLVEVDQVDQQLVADAADEAGRVPANAMPSSRGEDGHVPSVDLAAALSEKPVFSGGWASPLPPIASQPLSQPWQNKVLIHSSFLLSLHLFSTAFCGQDTNSFPHVQGAGVTAPRQVSPGAVAPVSFAQLWQLKSCPTRASSPAATHLLADGSRHGYGERPDVASP